MHLLSFTALLAGLALSAAINEEPGRLGCYDVNGDSFWKQRQNSHEKNTVHFCRNMCQDFKFAGLEHGQWCICGDKIPPKSLPDSRCNTPCSGDPRQTCGGNRALEIYPVEPKRVLLGKPMGCFQDANDRVWKTGLIKLKNNNSPQRCFNSCRGNRYAGLEAGDMCFCGKTLPRTPLAESSCQDECSGYGGKKCGGHLALDVYELSEQLAPVKVVGCVPLDYEQIDDLGSYKLFVQRKTWDDAWQQCEDDDAHLVIINSEDEAEYVRSLFEYVPSESSMHAGFHDLMRKGTYITLFGDPLSSTGYTVWSTDFPKVPSPEQHCGSLDVLAQLAQIDGNCAAQAVFVCEKKIYYSSDEYSDSTEFDVLEAFAARDS